MPRKKASHLRLVEDDLPDLVIHETNHYATAAALTRLIAGLPAIYRFQGKPARVDVDNNGTCSIVPLDAVDIITLAHQHARPVRMTSEGRQPARLPEKDVARIALRLLSATTTPLRPLDGFCTMPLLLDDGTINTAQGYHKPSRLYCHSLPDIAVPDRPTRADAEAALLQLRREFRTFPFADAAITKEKVLTGEQATELQVVDLSKTAAHDESAFITMLMTAVCRGSLALAPALGVTSPEFCGAGTGKGLLIQAVSIVATGTRAHVNSIGRGIEMEKGIVAALLQPDPIISLDNLNNLVLRSPALCTALTETPARLRPLGSSENREINTRAFIALNGNGLRMGEDLVRRVVMVELDAKVENPELRSFPGVFLTDIAEARPQLLGAILTIWRWGRQNADQLSRGLALGSFSQWAKWMRDVLITLGCCDPVERIETAKANDAGRLSTLSIFETWDEQFKDNEKTSKEAYDNEKVRASIEGGQQLTRQKFASKLFGLIGVRLGGYVMESPNKAEKERPENKKKMQFVPYTYRLVSPSRPPPGPPGPEPSGPDVTFLGVEPFVRCDYCGKHDGVIHHVRDNQHLGRPSMNLHEECVGPWFASQKSPDPTNDDEGLSRRRQELADWYKEETHRRYSQGRLDVPALDAELRAILREEVHPEHVEAEFELIMKVALDVDRTARTHRPSESKWPGLSPRAVDQLARELSELGINGATQLEAEIRKRLASSGVPPEAHEGEVEKIVRCIWGSRP